MRPAFSVVFLTTLLGVGQGLFLAAYAIDVLDAFAVRPGPQDPSFYTTACALSVAFLAAGLAASFFHLGHPERAWRAVAMWRTSWLSREVIVLPLFMASVAVYGMSHLPQAAGMLGPRDATIASLVAGGAATLLCLLLFLCTAMIYACLRFLQEWHTPLTVANYTLLGCASGLTAATALAAFMEPAQVEWLAAWALAFTAAGCVTRVASLARNARLAPKSTLQTAIGVKHPRIVQIAQGFMGGSFNTREFFHGCSALFLRRMRVIFLLAAFALPASLLVAGLASGVAACLLAAFLVQYAGLVAERWYFFAQANHPQNLYYQRIA